MKQMLLVAALMLLTPLLAGTRVHGQTSWTKGTTYEDRSAPVTLSHGSGQKAADNPIGDLNVSVVPSSTTLMGNVSDGMGSVYQPSSLIFGVAELRKLRSTFRSILVPTPADLVLTRSHVMCISTQILVERLVRADRYPIPPPSTTRLVPRSTISQISPLLAAAVGVLTLRAAPPLTCWLHP